DRHARISSWPGDPLQLKAGYIDADFLHPQTFPCTQTADHTFSGIRTGNLDLTQLLSCQQSGSNTTRIADKSPKWTVLFELDRKDVNYSSAEETIRAGLRDSGLEAR
ncbi:MAG: hypothetical protein QOJ51_1289, partial [Acidobacteriaceae bacterium]|nr:hypothetical protein [Acidobacteriaceae bacterium]